MSEIYLVRHGQASFGEDNYDKLSPTGIKQSKILARHLAKTGKLFDAIYFGEMERQQKTAQEFINFCSANEFSVPQPFIATEFNEYDSISVWQALLPEMTEEDASLLKDLENLPGDKKAFQRVFEKVMYRWVSGDYNASGIPRWDKFNQRVRRGIDKLVAHHGAKKRLAVFTSGGPISVIIQTALGLSDQKTLAISWQLMNASVTRIKYNSQEIMLAGFNDVTHLELEGDPSLLTYR